MFSVYATAQYTHTLHKTGHLLNPMDKQSEESNNRVINITTRRTGMPLLVLLLVALLLLLPCIVTDCVPFHNLCNHRFFLLHAAFPASSFLDCAG